MQVKYQSILNSFGQIVCSSRYKVNSMQYLTRNRDENVQRYAVSGEKDRVETEKESVRERERERERGY